MNEYFCKYHTNELSKCIDIFTNLKVDADDHRTLNISTKDIQEKFYPCDFILLKILIIRLRRRKSTEDWNLFKLILHRNLDIILSNNILKVRWLISFLDTYIDCGEETESANALIAVCFFKNETWFSTFSNGYEFKKIKYNFKLTRTFIGFNSQKPSDHAANYFKRMSNQLKKSPIIFRIFQKILETALKDKSTLLYRVSAFHEETNSFNPSIKKYIFNL